MAEERNVDEHKRLGAGTYARRDLELEGIVPTIDPQDPLDS